MNAKHAKNFFIHRGRLNRHLLTHSKEKHECITCKKKFNHRDLFNRHLLTHTKEKYECKACKKNFQVGTI